MQIRYVALALSAAAVIAATPPTDRPYVMAKTDRAPGEVAVCVQTFFDHFSGKGDLTPTDYGQRVDYRYGNLGGTVDSPTMSLEVHRDGTLILYGFKSWKGATKGVWKGAAKRCYPELRDAELVKPL